MRFRLRTLLIAIAIVLPLMAMQWLILWGDPFQLDGVVVWAYSMLALWIGVPIASAVAVILTAIYCIVRARGGTAS